MSVYEYSPVAIEGELLRWRYYELLSCNPRVPISVSSNTLSILTI